METKFKVDDIVKYQNNFYRIAQITAITDETCYYSVQYIASTQIDNNANIVYRIINSMFEDKMELVDTLAVTKKIITEPFNLEKAKQGAKLITKDKRMARIICYDAIGDMPIIALLKDHDRDFERVGRYFADGTLSKDIFSIDDGDLLIFIEEKWIAKEV